MADPSRANAALINEIARAYGGVPRRIDRYMFPLQSDPSMASDIFDFRGISGASRIALNYWKLVPSSENSGGGLSSGSPSRSDSAVRRHREVVARKMGRGGRR